MKIGNWYFDEKDILLVFLLLVILLLRFLKLTMIPLFSLDKIFIILFSSLIARAYLGKGKEEIIFAVVVISTLISNTLSFAGLFIFLLLVYFLISFLVKGY